MSEWDENKRIANLANHGVDVRELDALAWSNALEFEDLRRDYGERRLIALARTGRRLHVVVYVERDGARRYIFARKANSREIAYYEKQMASPKP
jgi:uncharacterized DUF497 family protein